VALQQTTRELWAQQGPFESYTIHGVPQQNIPEIYIKGAVWNAQADPPRYVAQSSAPEESGTGTWFPVDFNEEHVCWVEVRLQEPAGSESYWQAFRIAGQDLRIGHYARRRRSPSSNYHAKLLSGIGGKFSLLKGQHTIRTKRHSSTTIPIPTRKQGSRDSSYAS
jgi:hypothetical protein